jgi:membrane dipeptidase
MAAWPVSAEAARLHKDALVWDNHGCLPIRCDESFLPELARYHQSGVDMVSINVGFGDLEWQRHIEMLAHFRGWLAARPEEYVLALGVAEIERAKRQGKLAVAFDIEGVGAIQGQLSLIQLYYDLGVRWMLIAYNQNNLAGGGCHDEDAGLTSFGRTVIGEMARAGMVVCCSHTGYRTTLDVMAHSPKPVILSHSNPRANWDHPRNVPNEILDACAAGGGVVGINGIGIFLGENDCGTEAILRAIDSAVQRIGADHVGLGIDYAFDQEEVAEYVRANRDIFPPGAGYDAGIRMAPPEQMPEITEALLKHGYAERDIRAILGENFLRVAEQVWR